MTTDKTIINWLPFLSEAFINLGQASTLDILLRVLASQLLHITGAAIVEVDLLAGPTSILNPAISLQKNGAPSSLHLASVHEDFARKVLQQKDLISSANLDDSSSLDANILIGLPLSAIQIEGIVLLAFPEQDELSTQQRDAMILLVRQAAFQYHHLRIEFDEQRKTSHLTLLNVISQAMSEPVPSSVVLDDVLSAVQKMFKLDTLVVYSGSPMLVSHALGSQKPDLEALLGAGLARAAITEGHSLLAGDMEQDERCLAPAWASTQFFTEIAIPLETNGQTIGVLDAYCSRPETFDILDLQTLNTVGRQLAGVLRSERTTSLAFVSPDSQAMGSVVPVPDSDIDRLLIDSLGTLANAINADAAVLYRLHEQLLQEPLKWSDDKRLLSREVDDTETFALAQEALAFHRPLLAGRIQGLSWQQSSTRPDLKQGAYLAIPLGQDRDEFAVLVLAYHRVPRFTPEQSSLLQTLLAQMTILAQIATQSGLINQHLQQYALLYNLAINTHTLASPLEVIIETTEKLRTSMHWQTVEVYQWDTANRRFILLGKRQEDTYVRQNQEAIFDQVRKSMEPVVWNPKGTRPLGQLYTHNAEMAVPLMQNGKLRGIVYAKGSAKQRFDHGDSQFLLSIANLLSDTLNNIAVNAKLRQQLQEALTLNQIHRTIDYSANTDDVLQRIVETVFETMHCYGAHIATLTEDLSALVVRAQTGFARSNTLPKRYVLRESLLGRVAESQKPLSLTDVRALSDSLYGIPEVQSLLAAPLVNTNSETIGVLAVTSEQNAAFSRTDEHLLNVAAGQISLVIENLQLYEDLELRSERLKQAYQKLHDFTELKEQILQNVSHELRTPLTMVKGYVELLMAEELGPLAQAQHEALQTIVQRTDNLVTIIKQIVAVRPLGETDLAYTSVSADKLLHEVITYFDYRVSDTALKVNLRLDDPTLCFYGDEDKIRHICVNLLDNAIKFSPNGGHINVHAEQDGKFIHIKISDQGIGIPDQNLNRIFETFYQVDGSSTRQFGGLGLGLAAAHRLVEQQQGRIWVESEVDAGSVFHVMLPRAQDDACAL